MTTIRPDAHFPTLTELRIDVILVSDGRTTACNIRQNQPGQIINVGYGEAKRRRSDKRDPALGVNLAFLRALESAAESVRRELFITGHEDLCGLSKDTIRKIKEEYKRAGQLQHQTMEEMLAQLTGGVTIRDMGFHDDKHE